MENIEILEWAHSLHCSAEKTVQIYKISCFYMTLNTFSKICSTTDDMNSHVIPTMKRNPKKVILHCGTNDIRSQATPEKIAKEVMELAISLSTKENTVFVSGIVPRGDNWNNKVSEINKHLQSACSSRNMPFIDNSNISTEYHLNRSRLHLNPEGTRILANNFLFYLGY